jgi:quinol monooxygenase YgiN
VLVVTRHRADQDPETFLAQARAALEVLRARPGFVSAEVGRATDDPAWWVIVTRWTGVGAYRRALSSYEVKLGAVAFLSGAVDEPSAYEVVDALGTATQATGRSDRAADAESVGLGEASAPVVPTDISGGGRRIT